MLAPEVASDVRSEPNPLRPSWVTFDRQIRGCLCPFPLGTEGRSCLVCEYTRSLNGRAASVQLNGSHALQVAHLAARPAEDTQKPVGPGFDVVAQQRLKNRLVARAALVKRH